VLHDIFTVMETSKLNEVFRSAPTSTVMASLDTTVGVFLRAVNVGLPANEHKGTEFVEGLEKFLLEKCEASLAPRSSDASDRHHKSLIVQVSCPKDLHNFKVEMLPQGTSCGKLHFIKAMVREVNRLVGQVCLAHVGPAFCPLVGYLLSAGPTSPRLGGSCRPYRQPRRPCGRS